MSEVHNCTEGFTVNCCTREMPLSETQVRRRARILPSVDRWHWSENIGLAVALCNEMPLISVLSLDTEFELGNWAGLYRLHPD